jgi:7-cyano-7-deazaguanine synthase
MRKDKVIVLLSGGINSAVTVALALKQDYEVIALSIYYGQCHARELRSAQLLVDHYSIEEYFVSSLDMHLWTGSTLTDSQPSMRAITADRQSSPLYVPNRNMIFLSIALSLAEAKNASRIYIGTDQSIATNQNVSLNYRYSHTAEDTLDKLLDSASMEMIVAQNHRPIIEAPLRGYTKVDVMKLAVKLDVPIDLTWSCCQCLSTPCGICSSCRSRNAALMAVGLSHMATPMATSYV